MPKSLNQEDQRTYLVQDILAADVDLPEAMEKEISLPPSRNLKSYNRRKNRSQKTRVLYDEVHQNLLCEKHLRKELSSVEITAEEELELVKEKAADVSAVEKEKEERTKAATDKRVAALLHKPDDAAKKVAATRIQKTKGQTKKKKPQQRKRGPDATTQLMFAGSGSKGRRGAGRCRK